MTLADAYKKYDEKKPEIIKGVTYVGAGVMALGLTKGVYTIFTGFLSLTPAIMGYYGFLSGFCTMGIIGAGATHGTRMLQIYPDEVFHMSLTEIKADPKVGQVLGRDLGGHISSTGLKAYKVDGGRLSLEGGRPAWVPPRCQLIFDLKGEMYDALAVVEAVKVGGYTNLSFVGVEVMSSSNEKLVVKGEDSAIDFESDLRDLVSFKADKMKK